MVSPIKFAHVVLRTSRYDEVVAWWGTFLEAAPRHRDRFLTFLSYDDEHHRVAIANFPNLTDLSARSAGVEHVAFTYASIDDLFAQYERMRALGVVPYWTIHHGITLSAYYRDPDGNQVETQVDLMDMPTAEAFMASAAFAANPIGVDVDFGELIARRRAGESLDTLLAYSVG
jgi:catechol-2,3-dioxygenase